MAWKALALCVTVLLLALIARNLFDSAIASWIALCAIFAFIPVYWAFRVWAWRRTREILRSGPLRHGD